MDCVEFRKRLLEAFISSRTGPPALDPKTESFTHDMDVG